MLKLSDIIVYYCCGGRNAPLLKYFDPGNIFYEIDERVASFKALGHGLGLLRDYSHFKPVAVCTTSGTAVSQCLSALIEAYYSCAPFILISGDRPSELTRTAAPQSIDHYAITSKYCRSYIHVSITELENIDLTQVEFPCHINVVVAFEGEDMGPYQQKSIDSDEDTFFKYAKKPLLLLSHEQAPMTELIDACLLRNIPFYAETLSSGHQLSAFHDENQLAQAVKQGSFDSIIRVGYTPMFSLWRRLATCGLSLIHYDSRGYSAGQSGPVIRKNSQQLSHDREWLDRLQEIFQCWQDCSTYQVFKQRNLRYQRVHNYLSEYFHSEQAIVLKTQDTLPEGASIYLGNSLAIRHFELCQQKFFHVFANRGVNGIDGQLSTAIGIARTIHDTLYCFLGDQTFFYDVSALRHLPSNIVIIVINNNGGGIFRLKNDYSKQVTYQPIENLKEIVSGFGIDYLNLSLSDNSTDFSSFLDRLKKLRRTVIEIIPDDDQTQKVSQLLALGEVKL